MMIAVKKLVDVQKALNQAEVEAKTATLRRKAPAALEIVTIEALQGENGECQSPQTPKMLTFQDSELSHELQSAMSNPCYNCQEGLAMKQAGAISRSQESIGIRSRGSGHSQDNVLGKTKTDSKSQESLGSGDGSSSGKTTSLPCPHDVSPVHIVAPHQENANGLGPAHGGSPCKERNVPDGRDHYQRPVLQMAAPVAHPVKMLPSQYRVPPHPTLITPHTPSKGKTVPAFMYPQLPGKKPFCSAVEPTKQQHISHVPGNQDFTYLHPHCGLTNGVVPENGPRLNPVALPGAVPIIRCPVPGQEPNGDASKPKKRSQSLNRYAVSDGEPEEDDVGTGAVSTYATLTRRPGRNQWPRTADKSVNRSQSFALRGKRKGPPPAPPKRLSSVSSCQGQEAEREPASDSAAATQNAPDLVDGLPVKQEPSEEPANGGAGSVRSLAAKLEMNSSPGGQPKAMALLKLSRAERWENLDPIPKNPDHCGGGSMPSKEVTRAHEKVRDTASRRRTVSEPGVSVELAVITEPSQTDREEPKSDAEDEARSARGDLETSSSSQNSSSECIPFAEEGILTIKQRPKVNSGAREEGNIGSAATPDAVTVMPGDVGEESQAPEGNGAPATMGAAAKQLDIPEFNLTESDTVKRRHKPKEKELAQAPAAVLQHHVLAQGPRYADAQAVHIVDSRPQANPHSKSDLDDDACVEFRIAEIERSLQSLEKGTKKTLKPPLSPKPALSYLQQAPKQTAPVPVSTRPSLTKGPATEFCRNQSLLSTPPVSPKTTTTRGVPLASPKMSRLPQGGNLVTATGSNVMVKKAQQSLFFLRQLRKFGMSIGTLTNLYRCMIESILSGCITAWYGNCSAQDRKKLQKMVGIAQTITEANHPSMDSIYTARYRRKAANIIKDPSHP
eukprot:g43240.t1